MGESPVASVPEDLSVLGGLCQRVKELYVGVDKIQPQQNTGGHVSFTIIPKKDVDLEPFSDIQQAILVGVSRIRGMRCSVNDIRIAEPEEILCCELETKYERDAISFRFSRKPERVITISGTSSPQVKSAITGAILANLPVENTETQIRFLPHEDGEDSTVEPWGVRIRRIFEPLLRNL